MRVQVEAQVSGRVVRIEKQVGDGVELEEVILVIESMKMEIPVEAACEGSIQQILVGEGDTVAEGDVLAVLVDPT